MGVALEINQDVDFVGMDQVCGLAVRQSLNVDETVECGSKPCAHRAVIIGAIGIGENLEAATIVMLEQFGHQVRRGMLMKISGQIPETDPLLPNESPLVQNA